MNEQEQVPDLSSQRHEIVVTIENAKVGMRVKRNALNWPYENQDRNSGGPREGVITAIDNIRWELVTIVTTGDSKHCHVSWDGGHSNVYCIADEENAMEGNLCIADPASYLKELKEQREKQRIIESLKGKKANLKQTANFLNNLLSNP
jgi:hypothetical protein